MGDKSLFMLDQNNILISKFSKNHLSNTFKWINNPLIKYKFLFNKNVSKKGHHNWFENYMNDYSQKIFAINVSEVHIGNIGLKNINLKDQTSETWIYIGSNLDRGKGIAKKAYELFFIECRKMGIDYLEANIATFNKRSINLYKKLNFKLIKTTKKNYESKDGFIYLETYQLKL